PRGRRLGHHRQGALRRPLHPGRGPGGRARLDRSATGETGALMAGLEPRALLAMAEAAVDEVEALFTSGLGADPLITKARGDFATEVDLAIERPLRELLQHFTGFPVYGEEYRGSGADPLQDTVWVVDPIDGTTNYAAGFPMCAILVALLHKGEPVVALASMPLLCMRVTATLGGGTRVNGREVHMDRSEERRVGRGGRSRWATTPQET